MEGLLGLTNHCPLSTAQSTDAAEVDKPKYSPHGEELLLLLLLLLATVEVRQYPKMKKSSMALIVLYSLSL